MADEASRFAARIGGATGSRTPDLLRAMQALIPTELWPPSGIRRSRNWWNERNSNPHHPLARRGLSQLSYHPMGFAAKAGAWGRFRAHLSAFSARRFHQISFPGELARTRRIELLSPEWRSGIEPINYIRMVRPRGFEPLVGRPACFTDAGFTDRWQERDASVVVSFELVLARRSPRESKVAEGEGVRTLDREVGPVFGTGCVPPRTTFRCQSSASVVSNRKEPLRCVLSDD